MSPDEIKIATALAGVTFFPGTKTKALATSLARMAINHPHHELTERQRAAIIDIAIKYRRQIPIAIVDIAREMKGEA